MSTLVWIAFAAPQATADAIAEGLPQEARLMAVEDYPTAGATHLIMTDFNYYGPGYETGPWPEIEAVLTMLFDQPDMEGVWYGGDGDEGVHEPLTRTQMQAISRHFAEVGNR